MPRLGAIADRLGPDTLSALVAAGATELRVPARWPVLQTRPGQWDGGALEALTTDVTAARDAGLSPWLALLGRRVPGWFDDEGGFADAKTAARWWPRYVDALASELGDTVAGWFPMVNPTAFAAEIFAERDADVAMAGQRNLVAAWRDAWRILRGGPPVATALAVHPWDDTWVRALRSGEPLPNGLELEDLAGACDFLGGIVPIDHHTDVDLPTERLVRLATEGPEGPLIVLATLGGTVDDERAVAAETLVAAVRLVAHDGVTVEVVFADSLLATDGAPSAAADQLRLR